MDQPSPARVKSEVVHTYQRAGSSWDLLTLGSQSRAIPAGDTLAPASSCLASQFLADFPEPSRARGMDTLLPPCKWTATCFREFAVWCFVENISALN